MTDMILYENEIEKDVFEVKINLGDIKVDKNEIELSLGYPDGLMPEQFHDIVDEIVEQLPNNCNLKAGYRIIDVNKPTDISDGLIIGDVFFRTDKIVTGKLKKSEKAAIFVCTIGPAMETWSKQLMKAGDPSTSYFVDTVASVTAEATANLLHDHIGNKMRTLGMNFTNRYSPGYCNWSVSEQHLLFSLLPQNFCGIMLTDSALMIPIKSVSGIIGVGKDVRWQNYLCDSCGVKDCTYRSKRIEHLKKKV